MTSYWISEQIVRSMYWISEQIVRSMYRESWVTLALDVDFGGGGILQDWSEH